MKLRITVEGTSYEVEVDVLEDDGAPVAPAAAAPRAASSPAPAAGRAAPAARPAPARGPAPASAGGGEAACKAPIAGTVAQVKVKPGDAVQANQVLLVMEAMKMETNIASPVAGKVKAVRCEAGQAVKAGDVLVEFE